MSSWRNRSPMRARGRGRGQHPWTPIYLSDLRAWYDAEFGQPKNVGYVQLDGTSGDYIFTPDSSATSFSNDIEVVMRVKVTDWTAASAQTLVGKYVSTGNQRSWLFYVSAAGVIGLSVSADGSSTVTTVSVTPTNALPDNTWIWLRMRLDLTNGSNSVGTLETAADAGDNIEPSSWTANGTNTGTTISGVFDSTAPTEIGSFAAGTLERLAGQVGRCIVRSGFSGTTVADFNASDCYGDGYWHSGGYQWTLGLPKVYDRSANNRAPATFGSGSNQPRWLPWTGRSEVYCPGSSSDHVVSTAAIDATYVSATSTFTVHCKPTAGVNHGVGWLSANVTSSDSILYEVLSTGQLRIRAYDSTPILRSYGSSANISLGVEQYIRYQIQPNDGAGNTVVTFSTSTDGVTFTPVGSPQSVATSGAMYSLASTHTLRLGTSSGGGTRLDGTIASATFSDGVTATTFDAAQCTQTGYGIWTVTRGTSGRKLAVQSPAADSARSVILLGTDDYATVPAAAVPPMDSVSSTWSAVIVMRMFATPISGGRLVSFLLAAIGSEIVVSATGKLYGTSTDTVSYPASATASIASAADGKQHVGSLTIDGLAASFYYDAALAGTYTVPAAAVRPAGIAEIGRYTGGGLYQDMELRALLTFDRALTAAEVAHLTAYYGGGL